MTTFSNLSKASDMAFLRRPNREMEIEQALMPDEEEEHERTPREGSAGWRSEWRSIALLVFLYVLQGIPLGMGSAFIMFLQNRKISYAQQALFSMVTWPFSMKVLWAPIVDSLHLRSFGRRKSWLVPVQYMIGTFLIVLSTRLDIWFSDEHSAPDVQTLTKVFFALNFLAATQDIAVDGWALTMLSRRNVGHASTCNTVGQTAGYFLGHVVFLALESKDFANTYIYSTPQPTGLVTMSGYLRFWAYVFFIATTLVAIFKREQETQDDEDMDIEESYRFTFRIFFLPPVMLLSAFLMTAKIGFGIADGATALKLIEAGVQKENLALLSIPMVPLQIALPFFISRHVAGDRPLDVFIKAYPLRLVFGLILAAVVQWTHSFLGYFPLYYYVVIVAIYACHQVLVNACFVSLMAFFARISDPSMGGTYMTLLNTLSNFGGNWPMTFSMWLLDFMSTRECSLTGVRCNSESAEKECLKTGGACETVIDGFYIESMIFVIIGFVWLYGFGKQAAQKLQRLSPSDWAVPR
ncbi:acetyl-coenzyme A transporter 1 [Galendromus occidentalis]|uniref:Acetyl-coenzyme A transporter 1 n=1 Tax=Galendromus occidentalis TaxID=34638 RepID=A0AAJ6VZ69_9ACAR|nr:acetyl-coenzyme A transporter 1 [Galendromus occidentalis]